MEQLLRKLDLTSLRLFVTVCRERNIARAAEREIIAASAVSRRIAEIESLLGVKLIERKSRGVTVTAAGETVLRYADQIVATVEALGAELSRVHAGASGTVRVVANLSSVVQFLPEDVAAFERLYPLITISLEEQTSTHVLRTVAERGADVGICTAPEGVGGLSAQPYRDDRLALIVPQHHRLSGRAAVAFDDIVGEPFVGLRYDSALAQLLQHEAARRQRTLHTKIAVSSLDALCRMVHVGLGIAIVPQQVGTLYLRALDLDLIPLTDPWATRHLLIVTRDAGQLSSAARTLVRFLTQG
ncbi:LysR family transcriptional regulator [Chitinasiproducens palmae]|uniref:DNA-binding transcriptional regulator, LysR family n=1 Tax=Chitinasiproducens palmae TaxID=1770053 RepID=A0A1H2PPP8_9BURK|nr:LysR family transcriptional regulator [Chitinasiproducens palmae]SDV48291.1 DNA-binding transcriptional regulator, LysR family [Chitinasiproducens palmae]